MKKMLPPPIIEIIPDPPSLAIRAAEIFIQLAEKSLKTGRKFKVALAGGSTPQTTYLQLRKARLAWEEIYVFWGDERCVPPDHEDSNYHMAYETLLKTIPIPSRNIYRIHGELPSEQAAKNYEKALFGIFSGVTPRFDLVLLGLGNDGHTASLFPGSLALVEKNHLVVSVHHVVPPPPLVDRVTLTLPVFNAAAYVLFLVSGTEKAKPLAQILHGPHEPDLLPAQAIQPPEGTLHWLVDKDAGAIFSA